MYEEKGFSSVGYLAGVRLPSDFIYLVCLLEVKRKILVVDHHVDVILCLPITISKSTTSSRPL